MKEESERGLERGPCSVHLGFFSILTRPANRRNIAEWRYSDTKASFLKEHGGFSRPPGLRSKRLQHHLSPIMGSLIRAAVRCLGALVRNIHFRAGTLSADPSGTYSSGWGMWKLDTTRVA